MKKLSSTILSGFFCMSEDTAIESGLKTGFELKISDFGGYLGEDEIEKLDKKILLEIVSEIDKGKTTGIVCPANMDTNIYWELKLGNI